MEELHVGVEASCECYRIQGRIDANAGVVRGEGGDRAAGAAAHVDDGLLPRTRNEGENKLPDDFLPCEEPPMTILYLGECGELLTAHGDRWEGRRGVTSRRPRRMFHSSRRAGRMDRILTVERPPSRGWCRTGNTLMRRRRCSAFAMSSAARPKPRERRFRPVRTSRRINLNAQLTSIVVRSVMSNWPSASMNNTTSPCAAVNPVRRAMPYPRLDGWWITRTSGHS